MMKRILSLALIVGFSGHLASPTLRNAEAQTVLAAADTAKVVAVEATGTGSNYTLAVTISSPDTGCDRYADWWEVITPEGELLYRRVLLHSHVDEQPFTRTGGTVAVSPDQPLIVRVHMSDDGYSAIAQQGTVAAGFSEVQLPTDFASSLANDEPLPTNCAF
ncbi:MAG: hypothetical protein AAFR62_17305 [Cyanobacteria bacterium J06629_2]